MHKATRRLVWMLFGVLFLLLVATVIGYYIFHPVTQQSIPLDIIVGNYTGINLDADALHFGTVKPGSTAERYVYLRADRYDSEITLTVEGIPFMYPEQERIMLHKGESTNVRLIAAVSPLTPKQTYTGSLLIVTKAL